MTTKPQKIEGEKKEIHRHKWEDHCDCEYCGLEVCLSCGEERNHPKSRIYRPNSRTKVTQIEHSDGISQLTETKPL